MAPFSCCGTQTILNNRVLGRQSTNIEMNNRVLKIDEEPRENVDSSSLSNKKDEPCWGILLWLRTAALDPCKQKPPLEKLRRRQILKAREHISLNSTDFPWKKRKLDLLRNGSASSSPLAKATSISCPISITDSTEGSQQGLCAPSTSLGSSSCRDDLSRKRVRNGPFYESDDSISVASTPEKEHFQNIVNQSLKGCNNLPLKRVCMPQPKVTNKNISPLSDYDVTVDNSSLSSENSQEKHKAARRSPRLQNFVGDYLPRIEVPVGKRHQADIPDWIGPSKGDNYSAHGQRYLGTKVWPIEGKSTEDSKEEGIGKGRSDSCSCYSKGCASCVKLHVFKKALQLREDLGTAFFTWKFDEMGEEVVKSWTASEQLCFETVLRTDPISQTDTFLEPALKRLSGKCRKSILSYYFNVFLLRRMSKQIRLSTKFAYNDDDVLGTKSSIRRKSTRLLRQENTYPQF